MKFIALLRGINVSGQKKIKMADLRSMFEKMEFQDVVTYIQSGNVIFSSSEVNKNDLERKIKEGIQDTFGFDVLVLVKSREDFISIFQQNPYSDIENTRVYFALLKEAPEFHLIAALQNESYPNERYSITENCIYLACDNGYGNAKLNNNLLERKLKVSATTRNHRTMVQLIVLSENDSNAS